MAKKKQSVKKSIVSTIMILFLVLTFASWGIADYVDGSSNEELIATVGEVKISQQLFERELDRFRSYARQERPNVTEEELNNPLVVRGQLNQLLREQLVNLYIQKHHFYPSVDRVASTIAGQKEFEENGVFSSERYLNLLRQLRQTPEQFESGVRSKIANDLFLPRFSLTQTITPATSFRFRQFSGEKRKVFPHSFVAEAYEDKIKVTDEQLQEFYNVSKDLFDTPLRVQASYVELSPLTLRDSIPEPTDEELQVYWEELISKGEFIPQDKRDVRHILIRLGDDKAVAKKRAEEVLAKVRANPGQMAELAKEYSEDPGSKENGGLIKNVLRGQMVESFDKATFSQPAGVVSDLIETQFGFHILRVENLISANSLTIKDMKAELLPNYLAEETGELYDALSDEFLLLAEDEAENPEGLQLLAEEYQVPVGQSSWISEKLNEGEIYVIPFNDQQVRAAVLEDENIQSNALFTVNLEKEKRVFALQVTKHEPRKPRSFEEAKVDVLKAYKEIKILEKMQEDARTQLSALQDGSVKSDDVLWERPIDLNRFIPSLSEAVINQAYSLPSSSLPGYFLQKESNKKIVLYQLSEVAFDEETDEAIGAQVSETYERYWAERQQKMVMTALLNEFPITINEKALERIVKPAP